MKLGDKICRSVNYGMTCIDHTIKEIITDPGGVKKVLQLATKIFKAIDLYYDTNLSDREFSHAMKGTLDLIGFYGSYKDLIYWMNLFSKKNLDQRALESSINSALCAPYKDNNAAQQELARRVFQKVMENETFHSKGDVLEAIEKSLIEEGYAKNQAKIIAGFVKVQQKKRSSVELVYTACFTVTNLGGNLLNLQKMQILDLTRFASTIGNQSPIFMFVVRIGSDMVLGTIATAGLVLVLGESANKVRIHGWEYYHADTEEKREEAYKELRKGLIHLAATSTDLAATALPLIFVMNPTTILAFALVSKGTGLICFLIK